jgi:hypothetical protein
MFQVFDRVELDTAALEQFKRAARIPSAGIVIYRHSLHNFPSLRGRPENASFIAIEAHSEADARRWRPC